MVDKFTKPPYGDKLVEKINDIIDNKQDTLVSGTNIKTINNTSLLGSGNIDIQGGSGGLSYTATCPAITPVDGVATWNVTHNLGTQAVVTALYFDGNKIEHNTLVTSNNALTVTFKASSNVTAGSFKIVVLASGGSGSALPQFIRKYAVVADNVTYNKSSDVVYDLSSYLPDDGNNYEVLCYVMSISSASGVISVPVSTDLFYPDGYIRLASVRNMGWSGFEFTEHIYIPVGLERQITVRAVSWLGNTNYSFTLLGYKRIG